MEYFERVTRPQHLTSTSKLYVLLFPLRKNTLFLKSGMFSISWKIIHKTNCTSQGLIREAELVGLYISMCIWICYRDLTCNKSHGSSSLNSHCRTVVFASDAKTKSPGKAVGKGRGDQGQAGAHKEELAPVAVLSLILVCGGLVQKLELFVMNSTHSWSKSWRSWRQIQGKVEQLQAQLLPHKTRWIDRLRAKCEWQKATSNRKDITDMSPPVSKSPMKISLLAHFNQKRGILESTVQLSHLIHLEAITYTFMKAHWPLLQSVPWN